MGYPMSPSRIFMSREAVGAIDSPLISERSLFESLIVTHIELADCLCVSIYFFAATLARSARASRRLNLASWMTPMYQVSIDSADRMGWVLTGIRITREVASPLHESTALLLARSDRVAADGAEGARVAELRLGRDDRVSDVVVDGLFVLQSAISNGMLIERCILRCAPPASLRERCHP